jgi:hypothetical protein
MFGPTVRVTNNTRAANASGRIDLTRPRSSPAEAGASGDEGLLLFDGHFGRLNYRKNGIALLEIHSLE